MCSFDWKMFCKIYNVIKLHVAFSDPINSFKYHCFQMTMFIYKKA